MLDIRYEKKNRNTPSKIIKREIYTSSRARSAFVSTHLKKPDFGGRWLLRKKKGVIKKGIGLGYEDSGY